jgi:ParB family transcriptional regulator, chromosome partitioning protein
MSQNFGLGRGLSSLIPPKRKTTFDEAPAKINEPQDNFNYFGAAQTKPDTVSQVQSVPALTKNSVSEVELSKISENPHQPRMKFDETKLNELAESIKQHGVIQPIVLTRDGEKYEIIAGERRFQASKLAGLSKIPAIVREASNQEKLELAIVENIQRHDLNPIEEAKSYKKLSEEFEMAQEEIAVKLGKSRSAVANKIRLLNLPVEIQKALIEGKITEGHAKLLLAIPNPEKQRAFYELIIKNNLTVRQTEDKTKDITVHTHKRSLNVDPKIKDLENNLTGILGTKVKISKSGNGGKIVIEYYSEEELNNILGKIK